MFEQTFKNIDDILHKDAGCSSELDYTEQTSWMLFLKYLDDLEYTKSLEAELLGKKYKYIIDDKHRWGSWAAPKDEQGDFDHNNALMGDDLMDYVDGELFPYLKGFKQHAESPNTIEYKIGEIFGEIKNKIQSGYSLRDALEKIDELRFRSQEEKHELSHLYESKIKNMGNAGRNGGEYYTPRPLIRAMIDVVQPKIGETIYDGDAGSAGFLCEAFDYLRLGGRAKKKLSTSDLKKLQESTFYAKEKKSLAYVIAIMNMILHGIEAPNVLHTNTHGSYKTLKQHVELKDEEDFAWMVRSTDFEKKFKNDKRIISEHAYNYLTKSKLFGGDIIMSKIGNAGKVYYMPETDRPCSLAMNLFLIRIKPSRANNEYVYRYLNSSSGKAQIAPRLKGAATQTITKENVRSLLIPLMPLDVQKKSVKKLKQLEGEVEKLENLYLNKLSKIDDLKKSILQKAFTGELTKKNNKSKGAAT